ncbi:uncharacterized protein BYT42DRAFT_568370 [Radiomyces spectabilis]|uniref:uncharacterized protein n=1 Tax=Radiomyces spectabilis TaxID=64574 RepID=UPI0022201240|nr:uncharacterized protein BYT42DRAFT_568370 [Radiomyces spectabilis]KAI8379305.1 hypothetical protein BYT42DRAFT_568370 [Radiomyces spectabilis]
MLASQVPLPLCLVIFCFFLFAHISSFFSLLPGIIFRWKQTISLVILCLMPYTLCLMP